MEETFTYLLNLEFKHQYFKDGQFKALQVSLDEDAGSLLRSLGIILKEYPGGMHVFASNPEVLNNPALNTPIRLFLNCNDPYFINYSDLGNYSPSNNILYFNNRNPIQPSENTGISLHHKKYIGQNDIYKLSHGKLTLDGFDPANDYHFEDGLGNDISDEIHIEQSGQNAVLMANSYKGIIRVFANGIKTEQTYVITTPVWSKPLAIVELYLPQLFENFSQNEKPSYTLNFNTVKTKWKYFFVDPRYKNYPNLSIINQNQEHLFQRILDQSIHGNAALVFESIEELPLLQYSDDTYSLFNNDSSTPIINSLPNASPEQIFSDTETSSRYSHIYI